MFTIKWGKITTNYNNFKGKENAEWEKDVLWYIWLVCNFLQESPRKKKRKKSGQNPSNEENDFVAIGTSAGNILLYNVNKGDLQSQLVCENELLNF